MFHSWDRPRDYRISRLVSYLLGHQGSWVFHERLYSYSFVNRVNYDTQIKHSACKGLSSLLCYALPLGGGLPHISLDLEIALRKIGFVGLIAVPGTSILIETC